MHFLWDGINDMSKQWRIMTSSMLTNDSYNDDDGDDDDDIEGAWL